MTLLDARQMCIWSVFLIHSYTDSIEETVYYHITLTAIAGEIIFAAIKGSYISMPVYTLIFPSLLIIALSKFAHACAEADMELFFLVMLMAYNRGKTVGAYIVLYIFIALLMFLVYMAAVNIVRKIRYGELMGTGAFVPAMAAAFLIVEFLK